MKRDSIFERANEIKANSVPRLQRRIAAQKKRIAELEAKLAEQQKAIDSFEGWGDRMNDLRENLVAAQADSERLRKCLVWLANHSCIHKTVREGFGVQCSRCCAASALMGLEWHSTIEERHPSDWHDAAIRAMEEGDGTR